MNTKNHDELIEGMEEILKIKEVYCIIDDLRYSSLHLKLVLSKILLDYFKGNVREVNNFLSKYNHHLTELTKFI